MIDIGDMRQVQDTLSINLLIVRHVAREHLKSHIDAAKECLDFDDFGNVSCGRDEFIEGIWHRLVERDTQRNLDLVAECPPIDYGVLPSHYAVPPQLFDPS